MTVKLQPWQPEWKKKCEYPTTFLYQFCIHYPFISIIVIITFALVYCYCLLFLYSLLTVLFTVPIFITVLLPFLISLLCFCIPGQSVDVVFKINKPLSGYSLHFVANKCSWCKKKKIPLWDYLNLVLQRHLYHNLPTTKLTPLYAKQLSVGKC